MRQEDVVVYVLVSILLMADYETLFFALLLMFTDIKQLASFSSYLKILLFQIFVQCDMDNVTCHMSTNKSCQHLK